MHGSYPKYGDDDANQLQYLELYKHRLKILKPRLISAAENKFPEYEIKNLYQMAINEEAVICGIFVKTIKLQPEVLDEYLDDLDKPTPDNKLTDEDVLGFEDETQRTVVTGITNARLREIVTGQCVAILGKITPTGLFELLDWTVPEPAPKENIKIESPTVIGFGGDFRFGDEMAPNNLTLEVLSNFITCAAGEANEQMGKISRFAIAGIVATGTKFTKMHNGKYNTKEVTAAFKVADNYLHEISRFVPLDIFTGFGDCGSLSIPSPALHKVIFPQTRAGGLHCHATPCEYTINGTGLVNISELVINKMKEYSNLSNPLDIIERLLNVSHWVPISPDVIPAVPFQTTDPFVIQSLPDVVWCVGDEFEERIVSVGETEVLIFSVPRFATTKSIVLLKTKETSSKLPTLQLVQFSLPDF